MPRYRCESSPTMSDVCCESYSSQPSECHASVSKCESASNASCSASTTSTQQVCVKQVCPRICNYEEVVAVLDDPAPAQPSRTTSSTPQLTGFNAIISPVKALTPVYSPSNSAAVQFRMRRKNNTVTFQWESFTGATAQAGRAWIDLNQSIANLPPYQVRFPIQILYRGISRMTVVDVDPNDPVQVKFYLALNGEEINVDENFYIFGGSVTWIVD